MSLKSLCEKHRCTLVTESTATGASLGNIVTQTEYANRKCRIVPMSADLEDTFQQLGLEADYLVFFVYNPRTQAGGNKIREIHFTDENSDERKMRVVSEKNPDQLNRFWRYAGKEFAAVEGR